MNAEAWGVLMLMMLAFVAGQLFMGWWSRRRYNRFRQMRREEETRARFAELRNRLMSLVHKDKIDSRLELFSVLYTAQTIVMRHMPNHAEISHHLARSILLPAKQRAVAPHLPSNTPLEVLELIVETGRSLDALIFEYNGTLRLAALILRAAARAQRRHVYVPNSIVLESRRRLEQADENRSIAQTRDWMMKLAAC